MPSLLQPNFSKGQIGPAVYGRVDTGIYKAAVKQARNCLVDVRGGIMNRMGTKFIGPVKDHSNLPKLIPFQFNVSDTYMLEFGDQYMRVIRNDGHVLDTALNISGATQADPVVVTHASGSLSNGDEIYISGVAGMTELNDRRFKVANVTATTAELQDQITTTDIDGTGYTAYSSGGTVEPVFEISTPYAVAEVFDLQYTQSADVMTITHPNHSPRELTRSGHNAWTLSEITFAPNIADPTTLAVSVNGADNNIYWKYAVTAIDADTFEESLTAIASTGLTVASTTAANPVSVSITGHGLTDGDEVEFTGLTEMTELNGRRFFITKTDADNFTLNNEDGSGYDAETTGGANTCYPCFVGTGTLASPTGTTIPNNEITWAAVTGAIEYNIYRAKGGSGTFGLLNTTKELTFSDNETALQETDDSEAPPEQRNPFFGDDDKPGAVGYYQQRRSFGGTDNNPDTLHHTQTGNTNNMNRSRPSRADDAIEQTLNSEKVNRIRHLVSHRKDLLVFTAGSEWLVNFGEDAGFSVTTAQLEEQSQWGSANRPPIKIGNTVLYVQDNGKIVRSYGYTLDFDGYTGSDMTQLVEDLFEHYGIVDWCYARDPHSIIMCIKSDGSAGVLTFDKDQEIVAWTTWDTLGSYTSCASMRPTITDTYDSIFTVVTRTVGGNTVGMIERTVERRFQDVQDCYFVDSGLTLDSPFTITGATAADPVVITTSAAHGFSNGDEVDIVDITWTPQFDAHYNETQPDQLNGGRFTVANVTSTTFELQDDEGTDIDGSAYEAYVSGGEVRKVVTSITGLRHLAGRTDLVALTDGDVVDDITVSSTGGVTLSEGASRVHIGLRYVTDIETLDIEAPSTSVSTRTILDQNVNVSRVTFKFKDSRGMLVGPQSSRLVEWFQREDEVYDEPTRLLTGDKTITIKNEWNSNGRIFVRQKEPLPMWILAAIPDVEAGDGGN